MFSVISQRGEHVLLKKYFQLTTHTHTRQLMLTFACLMSTQETSLSLSGVYISAKYPVVMTTTQTYASSKWG